MPKKTNLSEKNFNKQFRWRTRVAIINYKLTNLTRYPTMNIQVLEDQRVDSSDGDLTITKLNWRTPLQKKNKN